MPIPTNVNRVPAKKSSTSSYVYDNLPEDTYQVEIFDIEHSQGPGRFSKNDDEIFDWLKFTTVVLNDDEFEGDNNGKQSTRGRRLWIDNVKWSMSPPGDYPASKLYRIASAANGGKIFNRQECNSFDPNSLIGKQLRVVVKEKPNKEGTRFYNNVTDYMSTRRLMTPYDPDTESHAAKANSKSDDEDDEDLPF